MPRKPSPPDRRSSPARSSPARVVVTGLGAVTGLAADAPGLEAALRRGASAVRPLDEGEMPELAPLRLAAPLVPFSWDERVAALEGTHPAAAARARKVMRTATRALRVTTAALLEAAAQAGLLDADAPDPEQTGLVVAGSNLGQGYVVEALQRFQRQSAYVPARYGVQFFDSHAVAALSAVLPAHGAGHTAGAGAASGNVAVMAAFDLIRSGRVERAVAVGPLTDFSAMEWTALGNISALAAGAEGLEPAAWCRPFDRRASGFVPGEGAAAVVLESAAAARRRGASALAEVLAAELVLDGTELPTPSAAGEARAMAAALRRAGVEPADIGLVSAHGTSTPAGDAAEAAAVRAVFGEEAGPWVNAPKGLLGHTFFAAGVLELVATVQQVRGGFVHANAHLTDPVDGAVRFAGDRTVDAPLRHAVNNAFGFGGFNASVLIGRTE